MTFVRRNIWKLGTAANPWHPVTLAYAKAVRSMQALPISDPRSWRYQGAIHGLAGMAPPVGAPWNECQHATWYFLPWHRAYLYQFERIVRSFVVANGGPADWALPYWNYEAANSNSLPLAFRAPKLPDNTPNPLFVAARNGGTAAVSINKGATIPGNVTTSSVAMAATDFTTPAVGNPVAFGGPRTGFAHFGPAPGLVENQPHNIMHVVIGGQSGLMTDPDTAALDPIFWLHHANIDRLWETWRLSPGRANPTTSTWTNRSFRLRNEQGASVRMRPKDVVDAKVQLDYTYDSITQPMGAAPAVVADSGSAVSGHKPVMVGRTDGPTALSVDGASAVVSVGDLPKRRRRRSAVAAVGDAVDMPRFHLELADIEGEGNPGVVYGVYVNLPPKPKDADLESHRVGLVSLFGIGQSTKRGEATQPLRYVFDITGHVSGAGDEVRVDLLPMDGVVKPRRGAAAAAPNVRVGTVAVHAS